jgi:hypothetical protein
MMVVFMYVVLFDFSCFRFAAQSRFDQYWHEPGGSYAHSECIDGDANLEPATVEAPKDTGLARSP